MDLYRVDSKRQAQRTWICHGRHCRAAAITPAAGWVGPLGAVVIGIVSSLVAYWAATWLKSTAGYDDALDVVGVHGFGGIVGTILVSFFASSALGGTEDGLDMMGQLGAQLTAIVGTAVYTLIISAIILKLVDVVVGLRVDEDIEVNGLDLANTAKSATTCKAAQTRSAPCR